MKRALISSVRALATIICFLFTRDEVTAATLEISQVADRARLSWSTNDAGFKLQFSPLLPPVDGWVTSPLPVETNGNKFELNLLNTSEAGRLFRLLQPGNSSPTLALVDPPAVLAAGTRTNVTISYSDMDGDLLLLEMIRGKGAETNHSIVPASLIGLGGKAGVKTISIDGRNLSFGTHAFRLRLHDSRGNTSAFASFALQVVGSPGGGTAPTLTLPTIGEPTSFTRPAGQFNRTRPPFPVTYSDPDGDLFRVRIVTISPGNQTNMVEESASALGMTGTNGTVRIPFLTFASTNLFGTYTVELTGIDRGGNVGATASRTVTLSAFSIQAPGLFLGAFTPLGGPEGTLVLLSGSTFDPVAGNNVVELNGIEVPVLALTNSSFSLLVRVPKGAETGPFIVRRPPGVFAVTAAKFVVPPSVRVVAESDPGTNDFTEAYSVQKGKRMQLRAEVVPLTQGGDRSVDWFVEGVAGGNASVGTVSASGLFAAPAAVPASGKITVTAALRASAAVTGSIDIEVTDTEALPGEPKLILAGSGGVVFSREWRASVSIPAGALNADTIVTVRESDLPGLAPPGNRLLGAAEFLPAGTVFGSPAAVTIPLSRMRSPGTTLSLFIYEPNTGTYVNEGISATVIEPGDRAVANLPHFTIVVVAEAISTPSGPAPVIGTIDPSSAREGDLIPVRLTGTGLSAGLEVDFLNADGTPATDISAVTYLGRDTEAGVLVEVGSIVGFDGGSRTYRLRLRRSDGASAETSFNVDGLPELIVSSGPPVVYNHPAPMVVSGVRIDPGGVIRVLGGNLEIESTGDVLINGRIDAAGSAGGSAVGQEAGGPGERGHGGWGGRGREDSEGFLGLDGAEPINYGRNGNDALGYSRPEQGASRPRSPTDQFPQGIGGPAGANLELDPLGLVAKVIECVGTGGSACVDAAISLAEQIRSVVNIIDGNGPGRRGYGAVEESALAETGGGGGGGGGLIEITLNIADLLDALELNVDIPLFDYVGVRVHGGGGGAGGDGGRDVAINTRRAVILGEGAEVSVAGGDGGNGSSESTMFVNSSAFDFTVPVLVPALPGGGGGGGRGGVLSVTAGLGVQRSSPDQFKSHGGRGGIGGVPFLDPQDRVSRYQLASAGDADGPRGRRFITGPLLDPATYRPAVTSRQLLALQGVNVLRSSTGFGVQLTPIRVRVRGSLPGEDRTFEIQYEPSRERYYGNVLLYRGWNQLSGPRLISQTVLVISTDADGDGLSDDDEADLGTNPNVADTDGDGLADGQEMVSNGNPLRADTDGDGLLDGVEFARGTALNRQDTDGDGAWDSAEVFFATNPKSAASKPLEIVPGTFLSSASHPETVGGAYLAAFNSVGQFGLLGRPAGGFGYGLAADKDADLYIADGTRLRIYDPLGQVATDVGEFAPDGAIQCATLTFNPVDRYLYGVKLGGAPDFANTGQLLRIDRRTGLATPIGPPLAQSIRTLACNPAGQLFAVIGDGSDVLVRLDATTGAVTQSVGNVNFAPIAGLAFNAAGSLFAVSPIDATSSRLVSVNTNNGFATQVSTVSRALSGLVVMPCAAPCLRFAGASPGWFFPSKLQSGDYDGDADDDLVLLAAQDSSLSRSSITFLRSQDNGLFQRDTNHPLSSLSGFVANELQLALLNNDAAPDVVTLNPFASTPGVSVLLNGGSGTFAAPVDVPTGLVDPRSLAVGDVNGDDMPDVVVAGSGALAMLMGDGTGGFGAPVGPFALEPEWFVLAVRLGDVDNDGDLDIVAMDSAVVLISLNNGGGVFSAPVATTFAYEDNGVELADVDGDGRSDIVAVRAGEGGGFSVLFSLGAGQLSAPVHTTFASGNAATNPQDFVLGDLNDDDLPDLVFATYSDNAVHVWLNQGDGTFKPRRKGPVFTQSGRPPLTVAIGDYNGDGKPDIAAGVLMFNQIWTWLSE